MCAGVEKAAWGKDYISIYRRVASAADAACCMLHAGKQTMRQTVRISV